MRSYLKENPISVAMGVLFMLCFGVTTFFLASSNSDLRQENRESKDRILQHETTISVLQDSIDTRDKDIAERDALIAQSKLEVDSLSNKFDVLSKRIVKDFPRYDVVISLGIDSQISVITELLGKADSLSR